MKSIFHLKGYSIVRRQQWYTAVHFSICVDIEMIETLLQAILEQVEQPKTRLRT